MKTDRELLVLAAKAAGIDAGWHCPEDEIEDQADDLAKSEGMWLKGARSPDNSKYWNPLIDDGDAFRLAVKLGIIVSFSVDLTAAYAKRWDIVPVNEPTTDEIGQIHNPDLLTATRRAIVLAAAAIGSRLP